MATLKVKLILCVVLFCINTNANGFEISDEAKEKIHNLIGAKQNILRPFLGQVKLETIKFGNDMRDIENEAKASFVAEVEKIINNVQSKAQIKSAEQNSKRVHNRKQERRQTKKYCVSSSNILVLVDPLLCKPADKSCVEQLRQQSEIIQSNCLSTAKPNLANYNKAFTKYSDFIPKIGETVQKCKSTHNDADSAVKCIENLLEDIGKEMKDSENALRNTIQEVQKGVLNMRSNLDSCQNQGIKDLQNKAKDCH